MRAVLGVCPPTESASSVFQVPRLSPPPNNNIYLTYSLLHTSLFHTLYSVYKPHISICLANNAVLPLLLRVALLRALLPLLPGRHLLPSSTSSSLTRLPLIRHSSRLLPCMLPLSKALVLVYLVRWLPLLRKFLRFL